MTYTSALSFSWALTWRLALANFVLILISLVFFAALGSSYRSTHASLIGIANAVLGWLIAWPFVVKRVLAPQQVFSNAESQKRFRVHYWAAVILGIVADVASLLPVVMTVLMVRFLGILIPNPVALLFFTCIRLFIVLPLGVQRLFRQLPEIA
jgi:hypothetical protein